MFCVKYYMVYDIIIPILIILYNDQIFVRKCRVVINFVKVGIFKYSIIIDTINIQMFRNEIQKYNFNR